jgi:hypothetical protein
VEKEARAPLEEEEKKDESEIVSPSSHQFLGASGLTAQQQVIYSPLHLSFHAEARVERRT